MKINFLSGLIVRWWFVRWQSIGISCILYMIFVVWIWSVLGGQQWIWIMLIETLMYTSFMLWLFFCGKLEWFLWQVLFIISLFFFSFLSASKPWNKFSCSLHLSVSIEVCFFFYLLWMLPSMLATRACYAFENILAWVPTFWMNTRQSDVPCQLST